MMRSQAAHGVVRRRGVVAVQVLVLLTVLLGFAALTVDVGALYNAKADLQSTADAAAKAAASVLGDFSSGDPVERARALAVEYAAKNLVFGHSVRLDPIADVTMGRAYYQADSDTYQFVPSDVLPDAVRVRARFTRDSLNGAMPLFFAGVLGKTETNLTVESIAMMVPRDIAVVADLSGSQNDDSELQHYQVADVNLHGVWDTLPGGADEVDGGLWDLSQIPPEWIEPDGSIPQAAGPGWGFFRETGWGTTQVDAGYNPAADAGLTRLPFNQGWTNAQLEGFLYDRGYIESEVQAILSSHYDAYGAYSNRVAVALGFANWNSGQPGGRWEQVGVPPEQTGNGNGWIGSGELQWQETLFNNTLQESRSIWYNYISYMASPWTRMSQANSAFRYRFGAKTFINFLLERRPRNSQTPELAAVPAQPMQAVKDAVNHLADLLTGLSTNDQLSLEVYGTTARHEVDLTTDFDAVGTRLSNMQAAHYDGWTNMGGGITRAIEELTSSRARSSARKTMILLTDGKANVNQWGGISYSGGKQYALAQAQAAADRGIRIFAVSVGADADIALMQQIAEIGSGEHFHAEGSIEEYSAQLDEIFLRLGGERPVQLIQ